MSISTITGTIPKTWRAKLGTFSKALDGSIGINFSESGSVNCDDSCLMKAKGCYAVHTERMKPSIHTSGERKRAQGVIRTAMAYIKQLARLNDNSVPWVRFSVFGSVPASLTRTEAAVFTELLKQAERVGAGGVHFPVETEAKRALYQALASESTDIVVRVSAQTKGAFKAAVYSHTAASVVWTKGETKRERLALARAFVSDIPRAIVCPAVAATIEKTASVKCGECTACSKSDIHVVYPQH